MNFRIATESDHGVQVSSQLEAAVTSHPKKAIVREMKK